MLRTAWLAVAAMILGVGIILGANPPGGRDVKVPIRDQVAENKPRHRVVNRRRAQGNPPTASQFLPPRLTPDRIKLRREGVTSRGNGENAADWNPHHGMDDLFWTIRDHSFGVRYRIPQAISTTINTIEWTNSTADNQDRPTVTHAFPLIVNTRGDVHDAANWRFMEYEWWEYQQLQQPQPDGRLARMIWQPNTYDVNQWQASIPVFDDEGKITGITYGIIFDFAEMPNRMRLSSKMSQVNFLDIGSDYDDKKEGQIRIGHRFVQLGHGFQIQQDKDEPHLRVGTSWQEHKDGKLYLRIKPTGVGGGTYGIELTKLRD